MFEGFTLDRGDVGDAVLRVRPGGSGPPVLLLHGHPRTHAMMEDYRAGLGIDRQHDEADRAAGRRIGCRCCSCGPSGTTWRISTATRWPSGGTGPEICSPASPSTAA